jgi:hypothetical protein
MSAPLTTTRARLRLSTRNNAKALCINMERQTRKNDSDHTNHRVTLRQEGLDDS